MPRFSHQVLTALKHWSGSLAALGVLNPLGFLGFLAMLLWFTSSTGHLLLSQQMSSDEELPVYWWFNASYVSISVYVYIVMLTTFAF